MANLKKQRKKKKKKRKKKKKKKTNMKNGRFFKKKKKKKKDSGLANGFQGAVFRGKVWGEGCKVYDFLLIGLW